MAISSTVFTGFDSQSPLESNVWKILGAPVTFGHFYCASAAPTAGTSSVFTVRITTFSGGTTSTTSAATTCTVATGTTSGSAAGTITLSAGQAIDVQVANGIAAGAVSWGLGP